MRNNIDSIYDSVVTNKRKEKIINIRVSSELHSLMKKSSSNTKESFSSIARRALISYFYPCILRDMIDIFNKPEDLETMLGSIESIDNFVNNFDKLIKLSEANQEIIDYLKNIKVEADKVKSEHIIKNINKVVQKDQNKYNHLLGWQVKSIAKIVATKLFNEFGKKEVTDPHTFEGFALALIDSEAINYMFPITKKGRHQLYELIIDAMRTEGTLIEKILGPETSNKTPQSKKK